MTIPSDLMMPGCRATRVRYKVVSMAVLLAMVTYLDRACISKLAPDIMRDLHLSDGQMSWVFSAFALAYALFEIPTAWWADRRGTRHVLTRIVIWWSAFTMATAATFNFSSLFVTRFLFGAGEAGAWPSVARTFSKWIPKSERGTVQGIFFSGAHLAGGLTPLLVVWLTQSVHVPWRLVFVIFGLTGLVWAAVWFLWFRNDPAEHAQVSPAELRLIVAERAPTCGHHEGWDYWKRLLAHRNTLPLCMMYFPNSFAFYFCITWLPTYLEKQQGLETMKLGLFAGLPLILSVAGDLFGGVTTDVVTKRFGLRAGRCAVGAAAYTLACGAMLLAVLAHQPMLAATLIAVSVAASMFILGAAWSTCLDIGGNHAGVISAAMNTSGALSSVVSPLLVNWLQHRYGWNVPLYVMGGLFLMGAVSWFFIDPRKRIFD